MQRSQDGLVSPRQTIDGPIDGKRGGPTTALHCFRDIAMPAGSPVGTLQCLVYFESVHISTVRASPDDRHGVREGSGRRE